MGIEARLGKLEGTLANEQEKPTVTLRFHGSEDDEELNRIHGGDGGGSCDTINIRFVQSNGKGGPAE